jgi:hypothetical protein
MTSLFTLLKGQREDQAQVPSLFFFMAPHIRDRARAPTRLDTSLGIMQISFYGCAARCGSMVGLSEFSYIIHRADNTSATHIIRAGTTNHHHPAPAEFAASHVIMHVMNRMIDSKTESPQNRTKACFILSKPHPTGQLARSSE